MVTEFGGVIASRSTPFESFLMSLTNENPPFSDELCMYVQYNLRVTNTLGNEGVHKSVMSVTLKSSTSIVALFNFHEEYAAMISIEHNLANTELELCNIEENLIVLYTNFDDTFQIFVQL